VPGREIRLVVTDLDNTLYDWLGFYVPSYLAMAEEIHRISGVDLLEIKRSFRKVHQAHGTTEYAFAIQELDALREVDAGLSVEERLRKYDSAIHAFRSMRKKTLRLYPGVRETLERLREVGIAVVAHSDSMMSYVSRRLRQLDVDALLAAICAPRDHGLPPALDPRLVRRASPEAVESRTTLLEFAAGLRKPDPATLEPVFQMLQIPRDRALYVGDSLSRDILLARRSGLTDVWARYGRHPRNGLYEELLEVTYWTEAEVAEEERLRMHIEGLSPSHTIDSFAELVGICGLPS